VRAGSLLATAQRSVAGARAQTRAAPPVVACTRALETSRSRVPTRALAVVAIDLQSFGAELARQRQVEARAQVADEALDLALGPDRWFEVFAARRAGSPGLRKRVQPGGRNGDVSAWRVGDIPAREPKGMLFSAVGTSVPKNGTDKPVRLPRGCLRGCSRFVGNWPDSRLLLCAWDFC
jgi:hypothetical protein